MRKETPERQVPAPAWSTPALSRSSSEGALAAGRFVVVAAPCPLLVGGGRGVDQYPEDFGQRLARAGEDGHAPVLERLRWRELPECERHEGLKVARDSEHRVARRGS